MRNKAKLGRAGTYGQRPSPCTRRQSHPAGAIEPNRAKQTQFAPAQNDRWGIPHSARECDCAKQTQFGPGQWLRRDRMCETKPKDRSRQSVAGSRLYKQTQFAGANRATSPRCPASGNKPNSRMRQNKTNFGRGKRAKQTQLGSPWRSGPETERAKQSQFERSRAGGRPAHEEMIMRNKAKPGRAGISGGRQLGRANCAKRTQFPARRSPRDARLCKTNQIWVASAAGTGGRSCETKPNLGGLGHLGDRTWAAPVVRNKANSSIAALRLPRFARNDML
jgi:hypothetical protein